MDGRTTTRLIATGLGLAGLLLAGCADGAADDGNPDEEPLAAAQEPDGPVAEEPPSDGVEGSDDEQDAAAEDEEAAEQEPATPFDPDAAVPLVELEVDGELIFPDGPMPENLVVPAGARAVTWSAEVGDNPQYHNATGALWVDDPEAEPDEVMAFFPQHLGSAGWELVEEQDGTGRQTWHQPNPEIEVWTQEFRVETVKTDDQATIRWWFTNNG